MARKNQPAHPDADPADERIPSWARPAHDALVGVGVIIGTAETQVAGGGEGFAFHVVPMAEGVPDLAVAVSRADPATRVAMLMDPDFTTSPMAHLLSLVARAVPRPGQTVAIHAADLDFLDVNFRWPALRIHAEAPDLLRPFAAVWAAPCSWAELDAEAGAPPRTPVTGPAFTSKRLPRAALDRMLDSLAQGEEPLLSNAADALGWLVLVSDTHAAVVARRLHALIDGGALSEPAAEVAQAILEDCGYQG